MSRWMARSIGDGAVGVVVAGMFDHWTEAGEREEGETAGCVGGLLNCGCELLVAGQLSSIFIHFHPSSSIAIYHHPFSYVLSA